MADDDPARSLREHAARDHRGGRRRPRRRRRHHGAAAYARRSACPTRSRAASRATRSLCLLEESNLARVADPAAGSGAIEALTHELCAAAWSAVPGDRKGRRRLGGAGKRLDPATSRRGARRAAESRRPRQGRSDRHQRISGYSRNRAGGARCRAGCRCAEKTQPPRPQRRCRGSGSPSRSKRCATRSDQILATTGARPKIFLANLGTPADFTARATFRQEFLRGRRHRGGRAVTAPCPDLPPHSSRRARRSPACARRTRSTKARRPRPRGAQGGRRAAHLSGRTAGRARSRAAGRRRADLSFTTAAMRWRH